MLRIEHVILLFGLLILGGCTAERVIVPPLTESPTGVYHPGKFVWFDLLTDDVAAAKTFYGELLGWTYEDNGDQNPMYTTVLQNGLPIGGFVASDQLKQEVKSSRWLSYLSVSDVDEAVTAIEAGGGKVFASGTDFPNRGRVAVVSDPQGALVAFVRGEAGDPVDSDPVAKRWFWTELWTSDLDGAAKFYQNLVGYVDDAEMMAAFEGNAYHIMRRDERPRAGMLKIPFEGVLPNWLPYVMVDDPSEIAKRGEALGGRVLLAPDGVYHGGSAIISDPTGGTFGVQKWPLDNPSGSR